MTQILELSAQTLTVTNILKKIDKVKNFTREKNI